MILVLMALIGAVVLVVGAPLRARRSDSAAASSTPGVRQAPGGRSTADGDERAQLEAAREAKYREIRDSELDFRTGKLSREDYAAIDAQLRAEAIAILDQLERLAREGEGA